MDWGQVGVGVAGLAGVTAAGAGLGAATNRSCTSNDSLSQAITCGPKMGAGMGGVTALFVGGVGGLLLAALSPKHKTAGLAAAAVTGGFVAVVAIAHLGST